MGEGHEQAHTRQKLQLGFTCSIWISHAEWQCPVLGPAYSQGVECYSCPPWEHEYHFYMLFKSNTYVHGSTEEKDLNLLKGPRKSL